MTKNKNQTGTPETKALSPREQVRLAFDSLIADQAWSEPDRKVVGRSLSTRELRFADPMTDSTVVLSESQRHSFVLGVDVSVGEQERRVQWTIRGSRHEYSPRAEVSYRDDKLTGSHVGVQYFCSRSDVPVKDIWTLGDIVKDNPAFPNPQINFKLEDGLSQVAFLLEQGIPDSYVEQLDLAPAH